MNTRTEIRHVRYEPWLLGWCRWAVELRHIMDGLAICEELESGSWLWRGRKAPYTEYAFEVETVRQVEVCRS